jgi:DNA helicase HerA-like ATPase
VLLEKIEQVMRLIRSKGVGVWFVTQNPADIPDRVQKHQLRLIEIAGFRQMFIQLRQQPQQAGGVELRHFFGEPMLDIADWMRVDDQGKGFINILSAEKLYQDVPHRRKTPASADRDRRLPADVHTAQTAATAGWCYQMPKLYATSLLWLLSELYEHLPEAGDLDQPKLDPEYPPGSG